MDGMTSDFIGNSIWPYCACDPSIRVQLSPARTSWHCAFDSDDVGEQHFLHLTGDT